MRTSPFLLTSGAIVLLMAASPLTTLRAGDENPTAPSPMAQMDHYLRDQHVAHVIETTGGDFKGDGLEMLTVRIYGVEDEPRQTTLCTALAATVKKTRVHAATVLFFASDPAGAAQKVEFQPSQLPGGNGSVEFSHDSSPASYHLQRTVKL